MATISQQVTSREGLEQIRSRYHAQEKDVKYRLLICAGAGCVSCGCHAVRDALVQTLNGVGLSGQGVASRNRVSGRLRPGPTLVVQPDDVLYTKLKPEDMPRIVNQHLMNGHIVEPLCYFDREKQERVRHFSEIEYFKRQVRLVTAHCGSMPYASIDAYIAFDGYQGLAKALFEMSREEVIEEMKRSGLRGRGGGGFPTGIKWDAGL